VVHALGAQLLRLTLVWRVGVWEAAVTYRWPAALPPSERALLNAVVGVAGPMGEGTLCQGVLAHGREGDYAGARDALAPLATDQEGRRFLLGAAEGKAGCLLA